MQKESSKKLRKLLDLLFQHLASLKKLSLPTDSWDALLIPIILSKLDYRTKREWEVKHDDSKLPTLNQVTEFLRKKCFSLEALQYDTSKTHKMQHLRQTKTQTPTSTDATRQLVKISSIQ